jgi:hypothetical protein
MASLCARPLFPISPDLAPAARRTAGASEQNAINCKYDWCASRSARKPRDSPGLSAWIVLSEGVKSLSLSGKLPPANLENVQFCSETFSPLRVKSLMPEINFRTFLAALKLADDD